MNKNFYNRFSMRALRALVLGLMLLTGFAAFGQTVQTITSSTAWVCPPGVTSVTVECWGGGGGGSGSSNSTNLYTGGGGAGGNYSKAILSVTANTSYPITIGAGGAAGTTSGNTSGGNGGTTSFSTLLYASGGTGGIGGQTSQKVGVGGVNGGVYLLTLTAPGGAGFTASTPTANPTGGGGMGATGTAARNSTTWATGKTWVLNDVIFATPNFYLVTTAGTGGTSAPNHTSGSATATGGTAVYQYQAGTNLSYATIVNMGSGYTSSSFTYTITAPSGGTDATVTASANPINVTGATTSFTGGSGGNGTYTASSTSNASGGGGGSAGSLGNGNAASGTTGGAAVTDGGAGANGTSTTSTAGVNATTVGGGGSGATGASKAGGAGFRGQVKLTYTVPILNYYYKGTGSLASTANWGSNTDGTGSNPSNFTTDLQVFYIRNTTAVTTDAPWTVSGSLAKIVVGDPSIAAVTLTIESGFGITGTVDVAAASSGSNSLVLKDATTFPTLGTLDATSEVHLQMLGILTTSNTFGKLFIDGGTTSTLSGNPIIQTSLTVASGSQLTVSGTSTLYTVINTGASVTINGYLKSGKIAGIFSYNVTTPGSGFGSLQFKDAVPNLTLASTSTVEYSRSTASSTQTISTLPSGMSYANLTISDAATNCPKSFAGAITVTGTFTLNQSASALTGCNNMTLATGATMVKTAGTFDVAPTFGATTNITYNGTTAVTPGLEMPTSGLNNLTINNTGGVTLASSLNAAGTLTLTAGKVTLGANNLTAAVISGGSSTAYVVTDGAGTLTSPTTNATLKLFPIGASTSSYDPVEVTPTTGVNFSARVTTAAPSNVSNSSNMAQREWLISASGAGSTVMSLTNGGTVYTPTTASMGHYKTDNTWEEFTGTTFSANKWTATNTSGSFSPFGGGELGAFNNAVLPVELSNFQVKRSQTSALLTWTTASEKDNAVFHIEQSTNGTDFQTVGQVKGHGTTSVSNSYSFEHTTPSVGVNYYRLKQVDLNGVSAYSAVRSIVFGKSGLAVKTTLVQDVLNIVTSDESATPLSIFNVAGQQVLNVKVQGEQSINVINLPAGLYIIRTATGEVGRFVKE